MKKTCAALFMTLALVLSAFASTPPSNPVVPGFKTLDGTNVPVNITQPSSGTNFVLDFAYPSQSLMATGSIVFGSSSDWPVTGVERRVHGFVYPTNYVRNVYSVNASTNWNIGGISGPFSIIPAGAGAEFFASIFGVGETNVVMNFVIKTPSASRVLSSFNPASIGGLTVWYDSANGVFKSEFGTNGVTTTGDVVKYWTDESGNNNFATNSATTTLLWNRWGGPNAFPALQISSVATTQLKTKSFSMTDPIWVFCVVYSFGATVICDTENSGSRMLIQAGSTLQIFSGTSMSTVTALTNRWFQASFKKSSTSSLIRTNGVQAISGNSGTGVANSGLTIGTDPTGGLGSQGWVPEILIYQAALTAQNITDIETYLMQKYGI